MYQSLNAYGQVTRESYANGVTTTRAFDANSGRLTGIDTAMGATKLQDNDYAWQSNGILRSRVSHVGGTAARSETFSYDVLDRLKTATATLTGHPAGRTLSMSYDRLGNLKTRTSSVSGDTDVTAYVYGSGGTGQPSLTTLRTVSIGGVSHTLTHDSSGRVTKYDGPGSDRYLGWNGRHLPTTVTVGDSLADATPKAKDELLYGPDGARYYKKSTWEVTDATTMTTSYPVEHTFYAGTHREVIRVGDAANSSVATSSVTATVLHIRTTPVSGSPTTSFEYLHRDHLGSVESVTDGTGAELKVQAYDPFGSRRADDWTRAMTDAERTALAGEAPRRTARGYTGHEHLERTGLIHMNGRVYDPAIGRFLSPDPIVADASFIQSWNAYSYALNSPLSYSDPSGLTAYCGWCDDNAYSVEWAQRVLGDLRNANWFTYRIHRLLLRYLDSLDFGGGSAPGAQNSPLSDSSFLGHHGETDAALRADLPTLRSDGTFSQIAEGSLSLFKGIRRADRHFDRLSGRYGGGQQVQAGVIEHMLLGEALALVLSANEQALGAAESILLANQLRMYSRQGTGLLLGIIVAGGPAINVYAGFGDVYHRIEQLALTNQIFISTINDPRSPILPQLPYQQRRRLERELSRILETTLSGL